MSYFLFAMCRKCNALNIKKATNKNICFLCQAELPLLNLMTRDQFKDFIKQINDFSERVLKEDEKTQN